MTKADEKSDMVEKRKKLMESFMNRIARHPILCTSVYFRQFVEAPNWVRIPFYRHN